MSSVPLPTFDATGLIVPDESDIQAGWLADFQDAFGGNLNPSPATPQGQIITALSAITGASNDLMLQYVNLVDPAFSSGRMQDAIARIYYLTRIPARSTVVAVTLNGANGTTIPAGALAQASGGAIYQNLSAVTIDSTGNVSATFQAIATGAIICPSATLNKIYRVVPGWDSITNPADGVVGRDAETAAEFEQRRSDSVAGNATGILPAVRGAVLSVPNVIDAYVTENSADAAITVGTVTVSKNSLYVSVFGGSDDDVARAIWTKKPPGCLYNGNTTVTVQDTDSGYSAPYPSYPVTFQRATALPIFISIGIADNGLVPSGAAALIAAAVVDAFNGADGRPRSRIGGIIYALRFAAAVQSVGSWSQVVTLTVGTAASPTGSEVVVPIDRMPTISAANITVSLA